MIALAVWFGLGRVAKSIDRSMAADSRPRSGPAVTDAVPAPVSLRNPVLGPAASAATETDALVRLQEQVLDAITAQKPDYAKACWHPKAGQSDVAPDLGGMAEVAVAVGADGLETGREIRDIAMQKDLLNCIQRQRMPKIQVKPPVRASTVKVSLGIP